MSKLETERGKSKTTAPWFKCFPKDWREGTRSLSAEHRGIYMDCLCLIYERDAPLPADDKWMSHALHVSIRCWRTALSVLAKHGKLIPLQDGWTNQRADEERLKRRSIADQNQIIAQSREDQKRENSKKPKDNNETTPRTVSRNEHHAGAFQSSESETDSKSSAVGAAPRLKIDYETVEKRLIPAANGALDNPVNCQGLLCTSVPQMWLDRGYDLERDILPSLEAAGRKHHGKRIKSWSYFTDIIADDAAKRGRSMPNKSAVDPKLHTLAPHLQALLDEAKALGFPS